VPLQVLDRRGGTRPARPTPANKAGKTRTPSVAVFRKDRPNYASQLQAVQRQNAPDFGEQDAIAECFCHD
jgi:hypothetical protein